MYAFYMHQRRRSLRPSAAAVQATEATWSLQWSSDGGWRRGSGRPDLISWIWSGLYLKLDTIDVGGRRCSSVSCTVRKPWRWWSSLSSEEIGQFCG